MARVIIEHPDGRQYAVERQAYKDLYEAEGFTVTGDMTPASFEPDVPRRPRRAARRKAAPKVSRETPSSSTEAEG
jgi:hypothetical protein